MSVCMPEIHARIQFDSITAMLHSLYGLDESDSVLDSGNRRYPLCHYDLHQLQLKQTKLHSELDRLPLRERCGSNRVNFRPHYKSEDTENNQPDNKENNWRTLKEYEKDPCFNTKVNYVTFWPSPAGRSDATKEESYLHTDPALLNEIYVNMKEKESRTVPLFRKSEHKISIKMRSAIVDWFVFTAQRFKLCTETLHLAVTYWDRYLFKVEVNVEDLLLVGTCAILLASKQEEARDNIPAIKDLIEHSNLYSKRDIIKMEQKMFKELEFKLSFSTAYQFLQIFCCVLNIKGKIAFLAQYICDIALIHEEVLFYNEPSKIAAASLALSNMLFEVPPRLDEIVALTAYHQNDLIIAVKLLFKKYDEIRDFEYKYVKAKYRCEEYNYVSDMRFPRVLNI